MVYVIPRSRVSSDNIKTLKGAVPICASCKSVRDDKGFWTSIENVLLDQTELLFTHSICVPCLKEQMPDLYQEMLENGEIPNQERNSPHGTTVPA